MWHISQDPGLLALYNIISLLWTWYFWGRNYKSMMYQMRHYYEIDYHSKRLDRALKNLK
jgi:hypothetical protein